MNLLRLSRSYCSIALKSDLISDGFVGLVGDTPLVRLASLSEETGCNIVAKAEWMAPGGSVKDRAALSIVCTAEKEGKLRQGGTMVEGTAGNTGVGLAHVCLSRGYKCIIYMPDNQSQEKMNLLRSLSVDLRPVPAVPYTDPIMYQHQARDCAMATEGAVWGNQFDNVANAIAHFDTTGPELWLQTQGKLDAFTCAAGTGGTIAGVARYLKQQSNGRIRTVLADPPGSVLFEYMNSGDLTRTGVSSVTEGIGNGRITENLAWGLNCIDEAVHIPDATSIEMVFRLLHEEGIFVGVSSALNAAAAVQVARQLGPGHTVATVLCDSGFRYASRLLSSSWLYEKGLLDIIPKEWQGVLSQ